jgi:hypothetical protein
MEPSADVRKGGKPTLAAPSPLRSEPLFFLIHSPRFDSVTWQSNRAGAGVHATVSALFLRWTGHIEKSHEFGADDDLKAIRISVGWREGRPMELWQQGRRVKVWDLAFCTDSRSGCSLATLYISRHLPCTPSGLPRLLHHATSIGTSAYRLVVLPSFVALGPCSIVRTSHSTSTL